MVAGSACWSGRFGFGSVVVIAAIGLLLGLVVAAPAAEAVPQSPATQQQAVDPIAYINAQNTGQVLSVTTGDYKQGHSCALTTDGVVFCWGANSDGQLGNGSNEDSDVPVPVKGLNGADQLTNMKQISAGGRHTCALAEGGAAYCWGRNNYGQLGTGTFSQSNIPVAVSETSLAGSPITPISMITAGDNHTCAISSTGTAYCWGDNIFGQLGIGSSSTNSSLPVEVASTTGLSNGSVTDISAG